MSLRLRLARGGAKKKPFYYIVAADQRAARDGRYIEKLGTYDPLLAKNDPKRVQYNEERVKHWLKVGAQPTDRVARFLSANGLAKWERGNNPKKAEPKAKAKERAGAADAAKAAPAPAETPAA